MLAIEIKHCARQKPSRDGNLEEKRTVCAYENASLKINANFIVTPLIYAKQKCLPTNRDPQRSFSFVSIGFEEVFSTFLVSKTFETTL